VATGAPAPAPGGAPRHLGLALVVISMAQLMLVLDELIVNTALPHIQRAPGLARLRRPGWPAAMAGQPGR
jgi:hypothetical protein